MLHILLINKHLVNCQKKLKLIGSEQPSCSVMLPKSTVEATAITEGQELRESESLTETSFARLTKTHSQVRNLIVDTYERLSLLNLHDSCDQSLVDLNQVKKRMDEVDNICLLEDGAAQRLLANLAQFETQISTQIPNKLMRLKLLCDHAR